MGNRKQSGFGALTRRVALWWALLLAAGCVHDEVELPANDAAGTDGMKRSPCVCAGLDYAPPVYRWSG